MIGSGYIDDLSTFSFLSEDKIIQELRVRFKKGQIYVCIEPFFFVLIFNNINKLVL